jgi:hypothetical protein
MLLAFIGGRAIVIPPNHDRLHRRFRYGSGRSDRSPTR